MIVIVKVRYYRRKKVLRLLKAYRFPLILMVSIAIGSAIGYFMGSDAEMFKPLGDLFLNLMFMIVVPLVFFSISSAVSNSDSMNRFGKIIASMLGVFISTGIIASVLMLLTVIIFPPAKGVNVELTKPDSVEQLSAADQFVKAFTVPDFVELLSRQNMLALIVFSVLVGVSASLAGEKAKPFSQFLQAGAEVFMKMVSLAMYLAPIGLGAYFASLIGVFGPELLGSYARSVIVYYPVSILYFLLGFTLYAFIAGGAEGVKAFWKNILTPAVTALGTGSSVASLPSNLEAAKKAGVPRDIRETVLPIGATIHMDGSCLSAILKISFLFGIFEMDFAGIDTFLTAIGIALLSGMVMSGVPGGGFIGEMIIVTMYGFPLEALPILAVLGTLVDPPATMVNVTGDNVSSMLVTRIIEGKNWIKRNMKFERELDIPMKKQSV
jgi:Na+/H+-dicarboxylate symporter